MVAGTWLLLERLALFATNVVTTAMPLRSMDLYLAVVRSERNVPIIMGGLRDFWLFIFFFWQQYINCQMVRVISATGSIRLPTQLRLSSTV